MIMLFGTLVYGCLAALSYVSPGFLKDILGFIKLRPMHASAALFWILIGGTGGIYYSLSQLHPGKLSLPLGWAQFTLWCVSIAGIFGSYLMGSFGGREYWEFPPIWALPLVAAWVLFLVQFFRTSGGPMHKPVYYWMWMSGILFFIFTFLENYLWVFPYFRNALITDMTIQWKVNGSMVGAWNQMIYGVSFYLMDRISGQTKAGLSKAAFAVYFLGFGNLLFNWGHHIYSLPTAAYVRYLGYVVSMTEWLLFVRIVWNWKKDLDDAQRHHHHFPFRFILAANIWVFLNLGLALLMSIPAVNLHTHGTHITVAHAMGTTIGINTMILLAAITYFLPLHNFKGKDTHGAFMILQVSLLVFWIALIVAGALRGQWQLDPEQGTFAQMTEQLQPWYLLMVVSGFAVALSLGYLLVRIFATLRSK